MSGRSQKASTIAILGIRKAQDIGADSLPYQRLYENETALVNSVSSSILEELDNKYMQGGRIITIHNNSDVLAFPELKLLHLILIRLPNDSVAYMLYAPFSVDFTLNKSPTEILDLGIQALKDADFPSIFIELVGLSDPEKISHLPFYMHPINTQDNSQPSWSHGRIVLVGDAAHAMPPFMAQGTNQGFEDAAVLVTFIAKLIQANDLAEANQVARAFEKYEEIRRFFAEKVQAATMDCHQWTQQQWDDFNDILHRREYPSSETLGE